MPYQASVRINIFMRLNEIQAPKAGESSGKPVIFKPNANVTTKQLTLQQIFNSVEHIPYYKEVIEDYDKQDFSWEVTEKVLEYAKYLKSHPQSVSRLPPIISIDGNLQDGAHRISALYLLQNRLDPKNNYWRTVKLKVQFGTAKDVQPGQGRLPDGTLWTRD